MYFYNQNKKAVLTNTTATNVRTELCPVCKGTGKYVHYHFARGQSTAHFDWWYETTCHGRNGKGWVVVPVYYGIR